MEHEARRRFRTFPTEDRDIVVASGRQDRFDTGSKVPRREPLDRLEEDVMAGHQSNDIAAHEATYASFLALAKWGTISVVVLLCLMGIFLLPH